ncbi:MAG TPA: restriction endonuclease, partial [Ktedonobacteraceae bacterium]|nr:restriction endonuclease [Ktedonobacteraceae bacterium]
MPSFIAQKHNEWLSLLEISGPFLSMPVLERVFPDGLDAVEGDLRHRLRSAYEQWVRDQDVGGKDVALHTAWIRFVLEKVLGMQRQVGSNGQTLNLLREGTTIPAHLSKRFDEHGGITLAPDYALCDPSGQGRLLIASYFAEQKLDEPLPHQQWPASPKDGMVDLLRYTGVTLGLVTNGEQWMLIYAPPHETTSFISWYAHLWLEEPLTLRALRSLLHQHRFFSVAEQDTLERLLAESVNF